LKQKSDLAGQAFFSMLIKKKEEKRKKIQRQKKFKVNRNSAVIPHDEDRKSKTFYGHECARRVRRRTPFNPSNLYAFTSGSQRSEREITF